MASTLAEVTALADAADRSVDGGFAATINFQPAGMGNVENTRADFGRPFAVRGNGLSYGWNRDLESAGDIVDRDSDRDLYALKETAAVGNGPAGEAQDVDERYDTVALVEPGDTWSIEVPAGRTYALAVVVGDPDFGDPGGAAPGFSETFIDVNDELFVRGELKSYWPFAETSGYVQPGPDGRITLDVGARTVGGGLLWVRVAEVEALPTYEEGDALDWTQVGGASADALNLPTSPVVRAEGGEGRLGDDLYLFGGFEQAYVDTYDRVDVLNLSDGSRSTSAPIPTNGPNTHAASAADEAREVIYFMGGQIGIDTDPNQPEDVIDDVYLFDPSDGGSWSQLPDLPAERTAGMAFVDGDTLHFLGGSDDVAVLAQSTALDAGSGRGRR